MIFDCDGVLVDTEVIANRALASMVTELGIPTTTEQSIARYMGRSWTSVMSILTEELAAPPPEDLLRRNREAVEDAWRSELLPVPGIVEALDRIALPYRVASSGDQTTTEFGSSSASQACSPDSREESSAPPT